MPPRPDSASSTASNGTARPVTPGKSRILGGSRPQASPEVRAALAAYKARSNRPGKQPSIDSTSSRLLPRRSSSNELRASPNSGSRVRKSTSSAVLRESTRTAFGGDELFESRVDNEGETWEESFGLPSIQSIIDKAAKTGRLTLSSRSLTAIPTAVYETLLPKASEYHPSNKVVATNLLSSGSIDLSLSRGDDGDDGVQWFERVDLTVLKASSNELETVDEEIAGFKNLQNLDLHHNHITQLPPSFGFLANLTILNLSSNRLETFPIQILALDGLTELDLSDNKLSTLWQTTWKSDLKHFLDEDRTPSKSPDASADSDFWSAFPSSPRKRTAANRTQTFAARSPLPSLKTLNVAKNALPSAALVDLPSGLVTLDVSANALREPLSTAAFADLASLTTLSLSTNELYEDLFDVPPASSFLPNLSSLDLTRNAFDALGRLESVFDRPISYIGLSPSLSHLIPKVFSPTLTITIRDNMLRDEAKRRRTLARAQAEPVPEPVQEPASIPSPTVDAVDEQLAATTLTASEVTSVPSIELTAEEPSSLLPDLFLAAFDQGSEELRLSGRSLTSLPVSSPPTSASFQPASIDLSKNALTSLPWTSLASWGWCTCLRKLTVTRNRLATLDVVTSNFVFDVLEELDLVNNQLPTVLPDGRNLFTTLAALAPRLDTVDLTFNSLTNLDGIEGLLAPSTSRGGLRVLRLAGNQIDQIEPLAKLAEQLDQTHAGRTRWKCEELDLRDNAITKLPPSLGLLPSPPLTVLSVRGNLFRVPPLRVYEEGGTSNLLKWLKDRI